MFEKYNIDDLYLAFIQVTFKDGYLNKLGDKLEGKLHSYNYITILAKENQQYIHLSQKPFKNYPMAQYSIKYLEPLSNYYSKKTEISKKKVLLETKQYHQKFYQEYLSKKTGLN